MVDFALDFFYSWMRNESKKVILSHLFTYHLDTKTILATTN